MDPNQGSGVPGYPPGGPGYPLPPRGGGYPAYGPPIEPPHEPTYGGGPPPYSYGPPPPAPAGISGLFRKWVRVTTQPGAASFAIELPTANWGDIWLSIIGLGVLTTITSYLSSLEFGLPVMPNMSQLPPDQQRAFTQIFQFARYLTFGSIITVPLVFFIVVGILFLFAKLFGGMGTFLQQAYAFALYYVPISGVSAIVRLAPGVGGFISFALFIYSVVLAIFAISASHRLSTGRSVAVVLLPLAILLVLACVALAVYVAFITISIQNH